MLLSSVYDLACFIMFAGKYFTLLYGCISQGLGTTEFTNLIG